MIEELKGYAIQHVGYAVADLDSAVEKFTKLLGVTEWRRVVFTPQKFWDEGATEPVSDYSLSIAIGTGLEGTCQIELLQPLTGESCIGRAVANGETGPHHMAFTVDNFDYWEAKMKELNAKVVFKSENHGQRCMYVADPDYGVVEMLERQ